MRIVETVDAVRAARAELGTLGLVPTMGYLHGGHIALIDSAKAENQSVAASIFVNPTQFGPAEDFARYPRDLQRDFAMLEGAVRPGHFRGVATVVCKLLNIVEAERAYFGQKDAQQTVVIRRMARDLNMRTEIVIVPTVREPDGLAMSSRNAYLTAEQRAAAPVLYAALQTARAAWEGGERRAVALRQRMSDTLAREPLAQIDYVSVADPATLAELDDIRDEALISLAVRIGQTRLIDNILLP